MCLCQVMAGGQARELPCGPVYQGPTPSEFEHPIGAAKFVDGRFACSQCPWTFANKGGLIEHVKRVHQKMARYQCATCGRGYSIRSNYHDHLTTHTGSKRHVCVLCRKQFTFKQGLAAHVLRFHVNDLANE